MGGAMEGTGAGVCGGAATDVTGFAAAGVAARGVAAAAVVAAVVTAVGVVSATALAPFDGAGVGLEPRPSHQPPASATTINGSSHSAQRPRAACVGTGRRAAQAASPISDGASPRRRRSSALRNAS
jgi:hypothetical protein